MEKREYGTNPMAECRREAHEKVDKAKIEAAVEKVFDCTPAGISKTLGLKAPIYAKTASYGHFGREGFPWEKTDKVNELKELTSK